ncbi:hypothetical protein [Actinoallomurus acaciae]|uniref:Uncharacterized protein n=1 Tax=Actinoallomurus acaciae TaxID=502577 RepID=A0ABV5YDA8_9ACTN
MTAGVAEEAGGPTAAWLRNAGSAARAVLYTATGTNVRFPTITATTMPFIGPG